MFDELSLPRTLLVDLVSETPLYNCIFKTLNMRINCMEGLSNDPVPIHNVHVNAI